MDNWIEVENAVTGNRGRGQKKDWLTKIKGWFTNPIEGTA